MAKFSFLYLAGVRFNRINPVGKTILVRWEWRFKTLNARRPIMERGDF